MWIELPPWSIQLGDDGISDAFLTPAANVECKRCVSTLVKSGLRKQSDCYSFLFDEAALTNVGQGKSIEKSLMWYVFINGCQMAADQVVERESTQNGTEMRC